MKNKILVSGATGDIGNAICKFFLEERWDVIGIARGEKDTSIKNHSFLFYQCDVTDQKAMKRLIEKNAEHFKDIDIIVNCAGILELAPFQDMPLKNWEQVFNTNFMGTVYFTKTFMPMLKDNIKSSIVLIGSRWGETGHVGASAYSASKSALKGLFKSLQFDLMNTNIRPFLISPGSVKGSMSTSVDSSADNEFICPLDLAKQILFLHNLPVNTTCDEIYMKAIPYDYK